MSEKFTEKNSYTIIFTVVMVIIVASILTLVSTSLKPMQEANYKNEKMQNILKSFGKEVSRDDAPEEYKKYITKTFVLDKDGNEVQGLDAFSIDTSKDKEHFPVFIATDNGVNYNIFPVRGVGLWDAIWGYVSFNKDLTLHDVVFDHKGETPGLGAEITQNFFQDEFQGEHPYDKDGDFQGIQVIKGYTESKNKEDGVVNAISGATITSSGVADMINNSLQPYLKYLKK